MIKKFKPINKAYKFRIYPNQQQQELIDKTIGCSRFIYNEFLAKAKEDEYNSYTKYSRQLPQLKKEYVTLPRFVGHRVKIYNIIRRCPKWENEELIQKNSKEMLLNTV